MTSSTSAAPPVALKKPSSVTHHGMTVADDYAWLRDKGYPTVDDPEIIAHLEAENALMSRRMAAGSRSTARQLSSFIQE